jgi:hypothetical protein
MRVRVNLGQRRRDLWGVAAPPDAAPPDAVAAGCVTPGASAAAGRPTFVDANCPYWTNVRSGCVAPHSARNRAPDVARPW